MRMNNTDRAWQWFGATDPYFAVLSDERFRNKRLSAAAIDEFFTSGERYTEWLFDAVGRHFPPHVPPSRALDFGCGVGRVLIPLSRRCEEVVGVDVSDAMLHVARRNCEERGISNAALVLGDDTLAGVQGTFDFVHSFIVFQHIPIWRGETLTRRLLSLLREDGIGALHYTYDVQRSALTRASTWVKVHLPLARPLANLIRRKPIATPVMQMNAYSLTRLVSILNNGGCDEICMRATLHGEAGGVVARGMMLLFRKRRLPRL